MPSAPLKLLLHDLYGMTQRVESWLIAMAAERRCALRLDRLTDRLTAMGQKINGLRARMHDNGGDEPVDEEATLREALKSLKEDIRSIRCQLMNMHPAQLSDRIQRAILRLGQIAEETYACADKLQWEIAEHDGRFCVPQDPALR